MRGEVVALLTALGVEVEVNDPLLDSVIRFVTQSILNDTNQSAIPAGLEPVAVYMAAGQFLDMKKGAGQLGGFDLEAAEKQIKEGDTTVSYAIGDGEQTPEQRLDALIAFLSEYGRDQLTTYRRIRWW